MPVRRPTPNPGPASAAANILAGLPGRLLLTLALMVLIVAAVTTTAALSFWFGRSAADDAAERWRDDVVDRTMRHVARQLHSLIDINELNAKALAGARKVRADSPAADLRTLNGFDVDFLVGRFSEQLAAFHDVTFVGLGFPNGDYLAVDRLMPGFFEVVIRSESTGGLLRIYKLDPPSGWRDNLIARPKEEYDATDRPWYKPVVEKGPAAGPVWSPVFVYRTSNTLGFNVSQALIDQTDRKTLLGVLTVSTSLDQLGEVLKGTRTSPDGSLIWLTDEAGNLVASSDTRTVPVEENGPDGRRVQIAASRSESLPVRRSVSMTPGHGPAAGPVVDHGHRYFFADGGLAAVVGEGEPPVPKWTLTLATTLAAVDPKAGTQATILFAVLAVGVTVGIGLLLTKALAAFQAAEHRARVAGLEAEKARLDVHFQQSSRAVIEWDENFRVRRWNPGAERIFEYTAYEADTKTASELILTDAVDHDVKKLFKRLIAEGQPETKVNVNRTKSGRRIRCRWENTPVFEGGRVVAVVSIAHDLIRDAWNQSEGPGFVQYVSHELRAPMKALLQALDRQDLNNAAAHAHALRRTVSDLWDFVRLQADKVKIEARRFSLRGCLRHALEAAEAARDEQRKPGLQLRLIPPEDDVPDELVGDEHRLGQVLNNLLINAVKNTAEKGSVTLRARGAGVWGDEVRVQFMVEDTGRGIPKEEQALIFQPLVQGGGPNSSREGAGLGLTICDGLVGLMGGELDLRSQEGAWSQFYFTLAFKSAGPGAASDEPDSGLFRAFAGPGGRSWVGSPGTELEFAL